MPGSLADDVAILMALTALELGCAESPLPPLVALAALPRLRRLWLADRGGCNFGVRPSVCGWAHQAQELHTCATSGRTLLREHVLGAGRNKRSVPEGARH